MLPASKNIQTVLWYQMSSILNLCTLSVSMNINIYIYVYIYIYSSIMLYITPPAFVQTTLGSLYRGDLIYPVPAHVHSQIGNLHHTCKNCPMQAKVLVKSHWYLGTSWLTSSRKNRRKSWIWIWVFTIWDEVPLRCLSLVRGSSEWWRIWIWIWNFPQVGKLDFSVKPWTEWKHVLSHKRQGQVLWSNSTSEGSQPSVGELEHTPKTRKATSSFTVDNFQCFGNHHPIETLPFMNRWLNQKRSVIAKKSCIEKVPHWEKERVIPKKNGFNEGAWSKRRVVFRR